jgi:hypothetical protein
MATRKDTKELRKQMHVLYFAKLLSYIEALEIKFSRWPFILLLLGPLRIKQTISDYHYKL